MTQFPICNSRPSRMGRLRAVGKSRRAAVRSAAFSPLLGLLPGALIAQGFRVKRLKFYASATAFCQTVWNDAQTHASIAANCRRPGPVVNRCREALPPVGALATRRRRQMPASVYAERVARSRPALQCQSRSYQSPSPCPMIGESPEWALRMMVGLLVFVMLLGALER